MQDFPPQPTNQPNEMILVATALTGYLRGPICMKLFKPSIIVQIPKTVLLRPNLTVKFAAKFATAATVSNGSSHTRKRSQKTNKANNKSQKSDREPFNIVSDHSRLDPLSWGYILPSLEAVITTNKHLLLLDPSTQNRVEKSFKTAIKLQLNQLQGTSVQLPVSSFLNASFQEAGALILSIITTPPRLDKIWPVCSRTEALEYLLHRLLDQHCQKHLLVTLSPKSVRKLEYSRPHEWYPRTRRMKRKIIMHVGPTNSGKTYHALKLLEKAQTGYYAGPLRLLAREIYEKFLEKGLRCNLITGEEVIPNVDKFGNVAGISSGTIEMIPTTKPMDVCIIDEIQMISDTRRGEAWTNALLGVQAKEIYCCGEASAVPLVQQIAQITGDEVEIKHYERLGDLKPSPGIVSLLTKLKKGDCLVAFSKLKILTYKRNIEHSTDLKVGVVYGALPPEVRASEAAKFNSGEYDVLVASDAIGMGLNLKINRVVFATTMKFDGVQSVPLTSLQIKQIAGRAGRYTSSGPLVGYYTAMHSRDMEAVKRGMKGSVEQLKRATVWPTQGVWLKYVTEFSSRHDLTDIITYLAKEDREDSQSTLFRLTDLSSRRDAFRVMRRTVENQIPFETQYRLLMVPVNLTHASASLQENVLKCFEALSNVELVDTFQLNIFNELVLQRETTNGINVDSAIAMVSELEEMHRLDLLFMWLLQRWPTIFHDKEGALEMKTFLERRITDELFNLKQLRRDKRSLQKWTKKRPFL